MGIYVLYDRFESPVQIGQSKIILERLRQHRRDHLRNRWAYFSWFGFWSVAANNGLNVKDQAVELRKMTKLGEALNEIEAVLIQVLEPRLNRRGPNWTESEEFLQVKKIHVESDDEDDDEGKDEI